MHRIASEGALTRKGQNYPVYTKYLLPRPQLWSVFLLYDQPFSKEVC